MTKTVLSVIAAGLLFGSPLFAQTPTPPTPIPPTPTPATVTLDYSTYLGGQSNDYGRAVEADSSGCAYVAGYTYSYDFPTANPYQPVQVSSYQYDAFVSRFSSDGSTLLYSTYLGGSYNEEAYGLALGEDGAATIGGRTDSYDFPVENAYQSAMSSSPDAFISRLDASGSILLYSTYLGGSDYDRANGIGVDSAGSAYVTGETQSINFPLQNPYQSYLYGAYDAFVSKLSSTGSALDYSTFLGGSSYETGSGIAVDAGGSAYVTGQTSSSGLPVFFPTRNAYQPSFAGGYYDAFVTRLSSTGSALVHSTYLGGSGDDVGAGIALDAGGNIYVTGNTNSSESPYFPTVNPYQSSHSTHPDYEVEDAFVSKFGPSGSNLLYSTYLGGTSPDYGMGIAVDSTGSAFVTGYTQSSGSGPFPIVNAYQSSLAGNNDAFVTRFAPAGSSLVFSTYLGGSSQDYAYGVDVGPGRSAFAAGYTSSSDFPVLNPYQASYAGNEDTFLARFGNLLTPSPTLTPQGYQTPTPPPSATPTPLTPTPPPSATPTPEGYKTPVPTPSPILWDYTYGTFLGGNSSDYGYAIAADSAGDFYVAGETSSSDFPLVNPYQAVMTSSPDAFVTKFLSTGSSLVFSTYLGGSNSDYGYGLALDSALNPFVTGYTYSDDFPTLSAYQSSRQSGKDGAETKEDAFVARLDSAGSSLLYSTYLGGTDNDGARGIAVDSNGSAYIVGSTQSSGSGPFPIVNAYQSSMTGFGYDYASDVFVAKLAPTGSALLFSTYLGGADQDYGYGIAVDSAGSAYVTGETMHSSGSLFPTVNAYQPDFGNGKYNAFVTKFATAGSFLVYSTFLGGDSYDYGYGIAVDSLGSAYVAGSTNSFSNNLFPTVNAYQPIPGGGQEDAFVTKFAPSGSTLAYSTFLGGGNTDNAYGIAVDAGRAAYVTGETDSSNAPYLFPTVNAYQPTLAGADDAFVSRFGPDGSTLSYSTFLGGGGGDDCGYGIAANAALRSTYVAGYTNSYDFPLMNPYQANMTSSPDAFAGLLVFAPTATPTPTMTPTPSVTPTPVGEVFEAPINATLNYAGSLDNSGFADNYDVYSCIKFPENAKDVVYRFVTGVPGTVTIDLGNLADDLDLLLCDAPSASSCVAASTNLGTEPERIVYPAAPDAYYLVVDGYGSASSAYDIAIAFTTPSPTPITPTPPPTPEPTEPPPTPEPSATPTVQPPPSPTPTCGPQVPVNLTALASGDYNGDGTADAAVFRPASGLWSVRNVTTCAYGLSADQASPGDYDGDGTSEIAVFRSPTGQWFVRDFTRFLYGASGDVSAASDYNGDGVSDAAVFRPATGRWYIRDITSVVHGLNGDWPVPGDYDGSGFAAVAVYRPAGGLWSVAGVTRFYFGNSLDWPVVFDYSGDGVPEAGVFRPCQAGMWAIRGITRVYFGNCLDWPRPADYDGNGVEEIGIFRGSSSLWSVKDLTLMYLGTAGDVPATR